MKSTMSGFPKDLAMEVLAKLGVKCLVRFKSVSKLWSHVISDPLFAKLYLQHQPSTNNHLLFLDLDNRKASVARVNPRKCYIAELFDNFYLPYEIGPEVKVLGYIDGLLCISSESKDILLFNPSTRECRRLKLPGEFSPATPGRSRSYYLAGIGYDKLTYDYKVVGIFFDSNTSLENNKVMVFALREGRWRVVRDEFPYSLGCNDTHRIPVNGAVHWFVKDHNKSRVIVSFDFATEEIREIPLPNRGDYADAIAEPYCRVELGVLEGRLLVMLHNQYDKEHRFYVQIWLMEEYGVSESWIQLDLSGLELQGPISCWKGPLFLYKNDRVFVMDAVELRGMKEFLSGDKFEDYSEFSATPFGFRNTMTKSVASPVSPFGFSGY